MIDSLASAYVAMVANGAALVAAGVSAASFLDPGDDADDPAIGAVGRVLVSVAWAIGVVPSIAFWICLITQARLAAWMIVAVSAVQCVAVALWRRRRGKPLVGPVMPTLKLATVPVLAAVAVGGLYGVTFDGRAHASESCIYRTAYAATGRQAPTSDLDPHIDLIDNNVEDARLGNTGVLASFLELFAGLGFRLLFALCGAMLAMAGYLLGRRVGGAAWGLGGAAVLSLNPYVLSFPQLDENLLALAFASALIPWLGGRRSWLAAGVIFGLAVTMRHVLLPAVLAPAFLAWEADRRRGLGAFGGGFLLATAVESLHHALAMGSVFRFESNPQFPPMPYRFGLEYAGFFNWPLHETLVRTPHNPFPMLITWPMQLLDHLGAVLAAALLVGIVALVRERRSDGLFWLLWTPVVWTGVSLQEAWDTTNKMWVMAILFGAFAAWTLAGLQWAGREPKRWAVIGGIAVALMVLPRSLTDWRAPLDDRYCLYEPGAAAERPELVDDDARTLTRHGPLPSFGRMGHNGPWLSGRHVRDLARSMGDPTIPTTGGPWGWFVGQTPPLGDAVTVEIDLSEPPYTWRDWAEVVDLPPDLDLTRPGVHRSSGVDVPWDDRLLQVWGEQDDQLAAVVVFFDDPGLDATCRSPKEPRAERLEDQRCWAVTTLLGRDESCDVGTRTVHAGGPVVRVRMRTGGLSLSIERSVGADRLVLWTGEVSGDAVQLAAPVEPWDN